MYGHHERIAYAETASGRQSRVLHVGERAIIKPYGPVLAPIDRTVGASSHVRSRLPPRAEINMSGMQIIGWDPVAKAIRSWTFDSDGGFAEATWTFKKDRWFIRNKGVLADGRKASMLNVIKPVDQNSFTWQTVERTAGGELLPNIDEVLIVRE